MIQKMDLLSAFSLLPGHFSKFSLLGMCIDDQLYIDKCIQFGCTCVFDFWEDFIITTLDRSKSQTIVRISIA